MINDKKSKVLIGCLALLLVMAVGYALFSETITINGTATAKGDFDLSYTCEKREEGGTGICTVTDNTITISSTFTKPTDEVVYDITITNTGSIPAVLKTVDSDNNTSSTDSSVAGDELYIDKTYALVAYHYIYSEGLIGDNAIEQAKITLQPGESLTHSIYTTWGDSEDLGITQPEVPEEGATINYNVTLGFEQVQAQ